MRYGLSFLPDVTPARMSPSSYFTRAVALAMQADRGGLDSVKMTEHYLHPYGGYCPSPLGFLAAVGACTTRIRLMTGGVLPAFHHPLRLAAEAAMVDALSGGRLDVGFARAYLPYEFAAFGVPLDESRVRFVATIDAVLRLWTEERVSIATPFFTIRDATALPRPTQRPHPPVWIAASLAPESFAWAGEHGFKIMATFVLTDRACLKELIGIYRDAFRRGVGENGPEVALSLPLYVADGDVEAQRDGAMYLRRYFDVWESAASSWSGIESTAYRGYTQMAEVIRASTPEHMQRTGSAVFGSPSRVVDHVYWLREELGVDHLLWQVDFGGMPSSAARTSLERFIDRVLPHVPGRLAESRPSADAAS